MPGPSTTVLTVTVLTRQGYGSDHVLPVRRDRPRPVRRASPSSPAARRRAPDADVGRRPSSCADLAGADPVASSFCPTCAACSASTSSWPSASRRPGHPAIAIDVLRPHRRTRSARRDFEYLPHVQQTAPETVALDVEAALTALADARSGRRRSPPSRSCRRTTRAAPGCRSRRSCRRARWPRPCWPPERRAERMAAAAGRKLGRVVSMRDSRIDEDFEFGELREAEVIALRAGGGERVPAVIRTTATALGGRRGRVRTDC